MKTGLSLGITAGRGRAVPGISTPTLTITGGTSDVSLTPELNTSAFANTGGASDSHVSTDWQISDQADFSNIVWQSMTDTTDKVQITVDSDLNDAASLYVRARHNGATYASSWSSAVAFTTIDVVVDQPSITSPSDDATDIGETPTITTGAFAVTNGSDTHASTDWQIASDSDFSTIVVQSLSDASNKVSWAVPSGNLSTSTEYFIRVRHNGTTYGASGWSSTVSFTTASAFSYTWTNTEGETFEAAMSGTYSNAKLALLDAYISNLKSGLDNGTNTWGGHDVLGLHFLDNATDGLRYFNAPATLMTNNGATHTPGQGYAGDGSDYINTNYDASVDGSQYTQNSASLGIWVRTAGSGLGAYGGIYDATADVVWIDRPASGNWRGYGPNSAVTPLAGTTSGASATGLLALNRSGASAREVYRNGAEENSNTTSSANVPAGDILLLAYNFTGSPASYSDGQISFSHIGRSFTANEWADIYAADDALLTAWAAA